MVERRRRLVSDQLQHSNVAVTARQIFLTEIDGGRVMKWWRFALLAAVLVVTLGSTDPDDACVKRTLINYGDGFKDVKKQFDALQLQLAALNLTDTSAKNQTEIEKQNLGLNFLPAIPQIRDVFGLPYVDGQRIRMPFEHSDHEFINVVSYQTNCKMPPYEIVKDDPYILAYPPPLPSYCDPSLYASSGTPDPRKKAELPARDKVIDFAKSVGRLKLRSIYYLYLSEEEVKKSKELAEKCKKSTDKSKNQADKGKELYACKRVELWGTGFMVGKKTFATSCHVVAPFLKNVNGIPELDQDKLKDSHEELFVNFTPTDVPANDLDDFPVKALSKCSSHDGLDIALLEVDSTKGQLPLPRPLFSGTIRDLARANNDFWRIGVLIGYGDLLHPIDETTSEMYQPYEKEYSDVKVAMLDGIITEDKCDDDLGIILDTVDTTVGESGSIVMDSLDWFNQDSPAFVLGVHTCCSAYFGLAKYTTPQPDLRCARLNRTFHNQDISSRSIL